MKKYILIIISLFVSLGWLRSQTTLGPGDLAFVGINTSGVDDEFAFVLFKAISSETVINFTDCGWSNQTSSFIQVVGDSHISWKSNSDLPIGTVVIITTHNGNQIPTANTGTVTGEKMLLSIAGDQVFAYQGASSTPQFIAAISFHKTGTSEPGNNFDGVANSNSTTELPPSLTIGENALHVYNPVTFTQENNSGYNGSITQGNKYDLLRTINNMNGWNLDGDIPIPPTSFEDLDFDVDITTGIEGSDNYEVIALFPNPTTDNFIVKGISSNARVSVFDMKGSLVLIKDINQGEPIDVREFPKGTYIVQVETKNKVSQYKLLVK